MFSKREKKVSATIFTSNLTKQLQLDLKKFNEQYPPIQIKSFDKSHDRFLIIDEESVYHIGASLKDLGKKWFAFSKIKLDPRVLTSKLMWLAIYAPRKSICIYQIVNTLPPYLEDSGFGILCS